jgi:hypothetical protein
LLKGRVSGKKLLTFLESMFHLCGVLCGKLIGVRIKRERKRTSQIFLSSRMFKSKTLGIYLIISFS